MSGAMGVLRRSAGFLLGGLGLAVTMAFVPALRLMSIDEEWGGWSDALPLVVLFAVLTLLAAWTTWRLLRDRQ